MENFSLDQLFLQEMNKIDGYRQTKRDPKELVESYKKRISVRPLRLIL